MLDWQTFKDRGNKFLGNIGTHDLFTLAGALAYTTSLALAPFVLIILALASLLSLDVQDKITTELTNAVGKTAGATIKAIMADADKHPKLSGLSGILGFLVLAVSASATFGQLRTALDRINEHKFEGDKSGIMNFVKEKFLSIGLVLGFAFLSIVSLITTVVIAVIYPEGEGWFWHLISSGVNLAMFSALFAAIYRFVPTDRLPWKDSFVAGTVSTVFYLLGKTLIGLYLGKAGLGSSYGAAGSLVVLLVWVFYTTLTFLISYEFTIHFVLSTREKARSRAQAA